MSINANSKELFFIKNEQAAYRKNKYIKIIWPFVEMYLFHISPHRFNSWRIILLRLFGAEIGKGCYISPRATIISPWFFKMGNCSSLDEYCYLQPPIQIGDYVSIANNVRLIADGHDVRSRDFKWISQPIIIEHGCFIGSSSYIGSGVHIGQFSVVGANSFVLKDIPENSIAFGNPCKRKSERLPLKDYKRFRYHK